MIYKKAHLYINNNLLQYVEDNVQLNPLIG